MTNNECRQYSPRFFFPSNFQYRVKHRKFFFAELSHVSYIKTDFGIHSFIPFPRKYF